LQITSRKAISQHLRRRFWTALTCAAMVVAAVFFSADVRTRSLVENTLLLIAATVAVSLPVGVALSVLLFRTDLAWRRATIALLAVLLWTPLYLQAAAWLAGFGVSGWFTLLTAGPYQAGLLDGWRGAIWVHSLAAIPWVVLIVGFGLRFVEPELEEAALLDGSPRQVLWRVTLRHARPAIGLAALWVALSVATDMTVTDLFQVRTYAEEIYTEFGLGTETGPPVGAGLGAVVTGCLAICAVWLCAAAAGWPAQLSPRRPLVYRLGKWRTAASLGIALFTIAMVGVPLASLIYKAGVVVTPSGNDFVRGWSVAKLWDIFSSSGGRYADEIRWSALTAGVAASLVVGLAIPLAWLARRGRWAALPAVSFSVASLAIPGPLIGVGLISLFNGADGSAAPMLHYLYDRTVFVTALGQAVHAFPVGMLIVWHGLNTVPCELLEAAAVDGASGWQRFWRVVVPLRWPAIGLAWLAAFLLAVGELSATILVVPPGVWTLGTRIAHLLHFNMQNELAGLCLFLLAAAFGIGIMIELVIRRFNSPAR
jgi:iron(III) transport system permease protein